MNHIAEHYTELGESEKSIQLLFQAIDNANIIDDEFLRANTLSKIARNLAELDGTEKAIQLLFQTISAKIDSSFIFVTIVTVCVHLVLIMQNQKKIAELRYLVQKANPIQSFWKYQIF